MLVIMMMFIAVMMFVAVIFFHLRGGAQYLQEIQRAAARVVFLHERALGPFVGFAADANEEIASRHFHEVDGGRLIAVEVCSVLLEKFNVETVGSFTYDLPCPVVERERRYDDLHAFFRMNRKARHHGSDGYKPRADDRFGILRDACDEQDLKPYRQGRISDRS